MNQSPKPERLRFRIRWNPEITLGNGLQIVTLLGVLIGLIVDREIKLSRLDQRSATLERAIEQISFSQVQLSDSVRRLAESQAAMQAVLRILENRKPDS